MAASVDLTIALEPPDEDGRENALDALCTVLTPDEELTGGAPQADREHLRSAAAA